MKPTLRSAGSPAFDFNCPQALTWDFEKEINFSTGCSSVETRSRAKWRCGDEILDNETFPAGADDGVAGQCVIVCDSKERVYKTAVADKDLGRFDEAFDVTP